MSDIRDAFPYYRNTLQLRRTALQQGGEPRFDYDGNLANKGYYHLNWKKAEQLKDHFLRKEHPLAEMIIQRAVERNLPSAKLTFDYTNSEHKITFFEEMKQNRAG